MRHSSLGMKRYECGTDSGAGIGTETDDQSQHKDIPARRMGCLMPKSSVMGVEMTDMEAIR